MNRRDFLKVSLTAGLAAALPFNLMSLTGCSDSDLDSTGKGDAPDISGKADLLVLGNIITVDDNMLFADAMTIKNGYVQYVGNKQTALTYCDSNTRRVDYGKLSVYPGFMEAHCHGSAAGLLENTIKLFDCETYAQYQEVIRDYIKQNPGRSVYKISGWRNIGGVLPTAKLLDEVSTEVQILGGSMDGHCYLMNTPAMEALHIYEPGWGSQYTATEVPRDAQGRPTGYFAEAASMEIQHTLPVGKEEIKDSIMAWQQFAFRNGFVAATEAGVNLLSDVVAEAYKELAKENKLQLRTRAFWDVTMDNANEDIVRKIEKLTKEQNGDYYKVVGLKIFIDGVVESHTALLTEKYSDEDTLGLDRYKDENGDPDHTLKQLVLAAHKRGLPTHTHTIGDGAVKKMLDAIEYAKNTIGNYDIRDMLAHIELIRPEDIKRFAKLNVSAIVAALWGPKDAITPFPEEEMLIGDRASNNYEIMNSFVKIGVNCAQHTDYPVSQAFGVPRTIYCGITRQLPEKGKESERLAQEAVTRLEMLKEMTINVAKTWHEEHRMGSLTPGKLANFVVYDCDFIDDDESKIPNANLKHVVIDGKEVYKG